MFLKISKSAVIRYSVSMYNTDVKNENADLAMVIKLILISVKLLKKNENIL